MSDEITYKDLSWEELQAMRRWALNEAIEKRMESAKCREVLNEISAEEKHRKQKRKTDPNGEWNYAMVRASKPDERGYRLKRHVGHYYEPNDFKL